MKYKVRIAKDGKTVTGLYSDKLPYSKLGTQQVNRASDVSFNEALQKWEIFIIAENRTLPDKFDKRDDAIKHEIAYLQEHHLGTQAKA